MSRTYATMASPIGELLLLAEGDALREIRFENDERSFEPAPWMGEGGPFLKRVRRQLDDYFAGRLESFDLPLEPQGTPFQREVWSQLSRIPFAATISYGELARRVGNPRASRAVGAANGKNPIPVVIPCHRVIGADGRLTGFGGGLPIKEYLLEHESGVVA